MLQEKRGDRLTVLALALTLAGDGLSRCRQSHRCRPLAACDKVSPKEFLVTCNDGPHLAGIQGLNQLRCPQFGHIVNWQGSLQSSVLIEYS
ncbi:hypothetical protein FIBSPDRAFT_865943 [Athelia psychrophila]|uniref:Uncharacterized protein n=1 Tax=Athelia psychrophila TaxID=1759441 RepID=A0A166F4Q4_9AGAM|nr:hypothetical protein FIBSPDRAFT_865943 [Fibularhizoctonia sp. CBS 109695]